MFKYILIILTFVLTFADVDARRRSHHNEDDNAQLQSNHHKSKKSHKKHYNDPYKSDQ